VEAIQFSVEQWLQTATKNLAEGATTGTSAAEMASGLKVLSKSLGKQAEERASFRLLQLNSQIIQEVAQGAGSSHYRWITEQDSRVRPNHVELHGEIHSWADPPMGGGTRPGDIGAPGSGYGCRCIAEPLPGKAPISALG
jgi:SPP1 gp7 family putative phage head morphogenesis protein